MVCLSAMLGISPMVCIWGVPHAPVSVLLRSGEQNPLTLPLFGRMPEPQSERRKLFGSPQAPYLRWCVFGRMPKPRGVYGERPMPPRQDVAAIRGAEPNQKDASCLGVPKPHISDGVYLGECPSPEVYMGRTPYPQRQDAAAIREKPEPQSGRRKLFGSSQAPYLRWRVFGSCPSPKVYMGSTPCPQDRTLPLFGRMPEPQFSFFTFHFLIFIFYSILHDTKHQLERHGILQTTH